MGQISVGANTLIQAQLRMGLPALPFSKSGKLWCAAKAFFLDGRPLREALALCATEEEAFEKLLLGVGRPFELALREVGGFDAGTKRGKKRRRPRLSALDENGLIEVSVEGTHIQSTDSKSARRMLRAKLH